MGYSPRQVLDYIDSGKDMIVSEMINSGSGLASFLSAWLSQENEEVVEAVLDNVEFYVYDTQPNSNKDIMIINDPNHGIHEVHLIRRRLSLDQAEIMQDTSSINECYDASSRLVPIYRLGKDSCDVGLNICSNTAVVREIRGVLYREIERYYRSEYVYSGYDMSL